MRRTPVPEMPRKVRQGRCMNGALDCPTPGLGIARLAVGRNLRERMAGPEGAVDLPSRPRRGRDGWRMAPHLPGSVSV